MDDAKRKIGVNFLWLASDRIAALIQAILVGAIVARYLGPEDFGVLAFASAIAVSVGPLVRFGSDKVVTREFIKQADRGELFWTVFVARIVFGVFVGFALTICVCAGVIHTDTPIEMLVISITALPLIFSGFEVSRFVLSADLMNKIAILPTIAVLLFISAAKLCLVYQQQSLIWFAIINAFGLVATNIAIFLCAKRAGLVPGVRLPNFSLLRKLLKECWPLIFSSLSAVLYMNVDCMMLRLMCGVSDAGVYSVAVRLSVALYFVPTALGVSFFPWLTNTFHDRPDSYLKVLHGFFEINALIAYACILLALLIFPSALLILFGEQYRESISVFRWHVFGVLFVFLGTARAQHLNIAKLHHFNFFATGCGLISNILLNVVLIPRYGCRGAAIATVLSFAVSALISSFFSRKLTKIGKLQLSALATAPVRAVSIIRNILSAK